MWRFISLFAENCEVSDSSFGVRGLRIMKDVAGNTMICALYNINEPQGHDDFAHVEISALLVIRPLGSRLH